MAPRAPIVHRKARARRLARVVGDTLSFVSPRRATPAPGPPQRIGVLLQWGIGDAVLALPLLQGLAEAFPGASIELIGKPWLADLFRGEACVGRTHLLVPPWTKFRAKYRIWETDWGRFAAQLRVVRRTRFDLLISVRFDPRETFQLRMLKATETAGFGAAGGRHWLTLDLGLTAAAYDARHRSEVGAHALEALTGVRRSNLPRLHVSEAARSKAQAWLRHRGYRGGLVLAIHGGAGHPIRRWGESNFNSVLKALPRAVRFVTVIGECGQDAAPEIEVPASVPSALWESGLADLKALLSLCDVLLCCDSGVMHMGAACGCYVVAIFGPGAIRWFSPAGPGHEVVRVDPMPCRPCLDHCIYPSPICMERVTPQAVSQALHRAVAALDSPRWQRA